MARNLICRTCLQMNKGFVNIFTHMENNKLLSQMLEQCTALEVIILIMKYTSYSDINEIC